MLYIILPIYNESDTIRHTITALRQDLGRTKYHIVAVNDGSTDQTLKKLQKIKNHSLTILTAKLNMNVGAAFASGIHTVFLKARPQDILIIMEADGTSAIDRIRPLVTAIQQGADIAIASRYVPAGGYRNFPLSRHVFSGVVNRMLRVVFPIEGVSDYTIFYRAYRVGLLVHARSHFGTFGLIQSKGFVANAELLIKLSIFSKKIVEIPFLYDYGIRKGKSKIDIFKTVNEYIVAIFYLKNLIRAIKTRTPVTIVKPY